MSTHAQIQKTLQALRWLPAYGWQRLARRAAGRRAPVHLIIAIADHFEPGFVPDAPSGALVPSAEQMRRILRWCDECPRAFGPYRDADGRVLRHTYFYPGEQYDRAQLDVMAEHCHAGWGEVEV